MNRTRNARINGRTTSTTSRTRQRILAAGLTPVLACLALGVGSHSASAIVGGSDSTINQHPWQVSLQTPDGHLCGGSAIDAYRIITAAHCTLGQTAADLAVLAGATDLEAGDGQYVQVAAVHDNPGYAAGDAADISVLILAQPLVFNESVAPIALASSDDIANAQSAEVTGWGALGETEDGTTILQSTPTPLVDDGTCNALMEGTDSWITDANELCAGGDGTDSCYGDSGGPLVVYGADGIPKLAGVVSWGVECGIKIPGVYAEVPAFADWVQSITPDTPVAEVAPTEESLDEEDTEDLGFDDEYTVDGDESTETDDEYAADESPVDESVDGGFDDSSDEMSDWDDDDGNTDDEFFEDETYDEVGHDEAESDESYNDYSDEDDAEGSYDDSDEDDDYWYYCGHAWG
jgi:trypsin